jgi:hypothetical protein
MGDFTAVSPVGGGHGGRAGEWRRGCSAGSCFLARGVAPAPRRLGVALLRAVDDNGSVRMGSLELCGPKSYAQPVSGAELRSVRVGATLDRPVNAAELVFLCVVFFLFSFFFSFLFIFLFSFFFFLIILNIFKI